MGAAKAMSSVPALAPEDRPLIPMISPTAATNVVGSLIVFPLASTYLTVVVPVDKVPDILSNDAYWSFLFCPLMAFNPTVRAVAGASVTLAFAVSTVQLEDSLFSVLFVVIVATIDGPPFGPPVGFHVNVYLIVLLQLDRLYPSVYVAVPATPLCFPCVAVNVPELLVVRKAPKGPSAGSFLSVFL